MSASSPETSVACSVGTKSVTVTNNGPSPVTVTVYFSDNTTMTRTMNEFDSREYASINRTVVSVTIQLTGTQAAGGSVVENH